MSGLRSVAGLAVPRGLPFVGHALKLLGHPGRFLLDAYRLHGPIFRLHAFGLELVCVIGAEANRRILVAEREKLSHALGYRLTRGILGDGLLFQDGEVHRRNRTLMTPAFHARGVAGYFDVIRDITERHLERWSAEGPASMYDRFRRLTFEVAARLILGCRGDLEIGRVSRMNDRLAKGTSSFIRVATPWTTYGRGLRARDELRDYLRSVIRERRAAPGNDALGLLMEARDEDGAALSEEELLDQAVILIFAGHETTTSMLTSFLLALRDHPVWRDRLVDEQRNVIGADAIRLDHVKDLRLLDAVLKEVERLWPPINLLQRGVVEEIELCGASLPPGTMVLFSPWVTHRLPELFADPERFDPERFLPPREEHKATPYALIGFGGGPRLCIGQAFASLEMKVVASELLRRHRFELTRGDPRFAYVPTLYPRSGLPGKIGVRPSITR